MTKGLTDGLWYSHPILGFTTWAVRPGSPSFNAFLKCHRLAVIPYRIGSKSWMCPRMRFSLCKIWIVLWSSILHWMETGEEELSCCAFRYLAKLPEDGWCEFEAIMYLFRYLEDVCPHSSLPETLRVSRLLCQSAVVSSFGSTKATSECLVLKASGHAWFAEHYLYFVVGLLNV